MSDLESRLEELFHRATELPVAARGAFLDEQCGDDADLRRRLEGLLRSDAAERFLQPAVRRAVDDAGSGEFPGSTRIGRYTIVRKIGEGGMGTVYEARQEHPSRTVALKIIRPGIASPAVLRRFTHEAQILGQLEHPGVACIYEAGIAEVRASPSADDGQPPRPLHFFAMEFVRGQTLTDYASRRELGISGRLELFARICDAVQHAHQKGVIHRDLKPANILVVDDAAAGAPTAGPVGHPKILDFGVARLTDAGVQAMTLQTDVGQLIGTLPYMSPEQVLADSRALDARSDIYSLGVILFELLSGRRPYDLHGRSLAEAARVIAEQEPTRLGSLDTALRGDLDTIVLKALEKEKDRRYLSAADLAADIRRYLSDQPIAARPQTTFYLLRKFARRNRGLVIGSTAAVLSLVVGLIVVSILAHREAQQRRAAERIAYRASIGSASARLQNHDVASARMSLENAPEYLRGWEWRYLWNRLDESLRSIQVDSATPAYAFMNAAGTTVLSSLPLPSPVLRSWDVSGDPVRLQSEEVGVRFYAQSPRGSAALWFTSDGTLRIRRTDARAAQELARPPCRPEGPRRNYWYMPSDDARLVLFLELGSNQVCVMDVRSGEHFTRSVFLDAWHHLPVFAGGDWLASPILDCQCVELWNFRTGQARIIARHPATIESMAMSPDGAHLYTGSQDSILRRWNVQSGDLEAMGQGHSGYILYLACSPDGRLVATNSTENTVRLWDAATLQARRVYHGHTSRVNSLVFSPDSTRVITMANDASIRIWDAVGSAAPGVRRNHRGYVYSVAFSPDGRRVVSAGWDGFFKSPGGIKLWQAPAFEPVIEVGEAGDWFFHAAFSPDGRKLAATGIKGLTIYDSATGQVLARRTDLARTDHRLAFDPAGGRVLFAGRFLDASTAADLPCRIMDSAQVVWSRNGNWIATHSDGPGPRVQLWDAISQRRVRELIGPRSAVVETAFSHDGRFLAAASDERTVCVWTVDDGRRVAALDTPGGGALCLAFNPDGTRLATGGRDQVIHLWDMNTFEEVAQLHGHNAYVKSLAFSPDGTTLLSGSGDGTIRIWDASPIRPGGIAKGS
jgi:WD40 repeat protein/serine/threonine protein kinase